MSGKSTNPLEISISWPSASAAAAFAIQDSRCFNIWFSPEIPSDFPANFTGAVKDSIFFGENSKRWALEITCLLVCKLENLDFWSENWVKFEIEAIEKERKNNWYKTLLENNKKSHS